ncbi:MAG TPA: hypothetical protein VI653_30190, partial [Steroidobacteraceae bacterium]
MNPLLTLGGATVSLSLLLGAAVTQAAAPAAATKITPMTPDDVATYETVRPQADYIKRVVMV